MAAAVGGRRLLELAWLNVTSRRISLRNRDAKVVARLVLESLRVEGGRGGEAAVSLAELAPLRGYGSAASKVAGVLLGAGLEPAAPQTLAWAADVLGMPPPGSTPGPAPLLERGQPAGAALAAVLARLLEMATSSELGALERLDSEFLHEYRVALRRARSVLRLGEAVLGAPALALGAELRWLAALTGPARDLDVHLARLPAGVGELDPLRVHLSARRESAQRDLVSALSSPRYAELLRAWKELAASARPAPAGTEPLLGAMADRLVARAHRRVLRRGRRIDGSTPAPALHDLRKRAKELRYLLECFAAIYPGGPRDAAVRELKALQDNLGEYQDCQVEALALREMADDLYEARSAGMDTLVAIWRLAEDLERREARARAGFHARFERFDSPGVRKRFAALAPSRGGGRR